MPEHAIEIRGLQKRFDRFALGPLDLTVPMGAIYAFVGPNGAGKTTTIDLMFGMGARDGGTISVLGFDHERDDVEMKRRVGYVSPELNFRQWGRVGRAVQFVRGFYPSWDQEYCDRLLKAFDLNPDAHIGSLSFGARTKLALVLAMAWRPKVLVLDEPTTGLDAISKRQMFAELLAAVQDEGRTVLISSHAIGDLERFADHVGMIKQGGMIFEGPISDVAERFRMVDFVADGYVPLDDVPGVHVQERSGDRFRALVDRQAASLEAVRALGLRDVAEAPVSLEDLFIALGRA